ncbi:MAG: hypothetical protein SO442_04060 [Prevotella sp.]|nr:hypothetical protein [Prevotella sp.]
MVYEKSLAEEFTQRIKRYNRDIFVPYFKQILVEEAIMVLQTHGEDYFQNVTGNLENSIACGCYYKGELYHIVTMREAEYSTPNPTRRTLRKGERYNLEYYAGGVPAKRLIPGTDKYTRPFVGTYGQGGQDGESVAIWRLRRMKIPKKSVYALVVVAGVSYAGIVANTHDVLRERMDFLKNYAQDDITSRWA